MNKYLKLLLIIYIAYSLTALTHELMHYFMEYKEVKELCVIGYINDGNLTTTSWIKGYAKDDYKSSGIDTDLSFITILQLVITFFILFIFSFRTSKGCLYKLITKRWCLKRKV